MKNFDYVLPRSAAEASAAAAKPGAVLKAGGTELLDRLKEGILSPAALVNLLSVDGLAGVREEGGRLVVGATTTLDALDHDPLLKAKAPALAEAARETATPLVRNRGTVGGNLCQRPRCWYFRNEAYDCLKRTGSECFGHAGENKYLAILGNGKCAAVHPSNLATILWALDATLKIADGAKTTDLGFDAFFVAPEKDATRENVLAPGQVIASVSFDAAKSYGAAYYEINEKESFDWALASCGARLAFDGDRVAEARVVVSAVAPTPLRLEAVEKKLVGSALDDAALAAAGEAAVAGATPLRDNAYKVRLLKVAVRRALKLAAGRAKERR